MQLERNNIHTWKDLAMAFLKQYQYNTNIAPSRTQLQNLSQKSDESFKEYAQRWKEVSAHIQPPMLDRELVDVFLSTMQSPYLERMIGIVSLSFSDPVIVGEYTESGLKSGKLQGASSSRTSERNLLMILKRKMRMKLIQSGKLRPRCHMANIHM